MLNFCLINLINGTNSEDLGILNLNNFSSLKNWNSEFKSCLFTCSLIGIALIYISSLIGKFTNERKRNLVLFSTMVYFIFYVLYISIGVFIINDIAKFEGVINIYYFVVIILLFILIPIFLVDFVFGVPLGVIDPSSVAKFETISLGYAIFTQFHFILFALTGSVTIKFLSSFIIYLTFTCSTLLLIAVLVTRFNGFPRNSGQYFVRDEEELDILV